MPSSGQYNGRSQLKDESLAEHREILSYLTGHDATGAERAMRRHIAALRNSLQQANYFSIA